MENGFNAENDRIQTQNETAKGLFKMMHKIMTDYEKVIVVLSKGYKEKANGFTAGVGNEYNLILEDIEVNKNKYILISFGPHSDEITPLNFMGREIINVLYKSNMNKLFSKINNENVIQFSEVAKQKPIISKLIVSDFEFQDSNLKIRSLNSKISTANYFANKIMEIEYDLILEIENLTKQTFSEYSMEISYPKSSLNYNIEGRIEENQIIVDLEIKAKLFSGKIKSFNLNKLKISNKNAEDILNSKIVINLYSDNGLVSKEFPLDKILENIKKEKLSVTMFLKSDLI